MFAAQTHEGCLIEDLGSDFLRDYLQRDGLTPLLRFAVIEELRLRADLAAGCDGPPDADAFAEWLRLRAEQEGLTYEQAAIALAGHRDRIEVAGLDTALAPRAMGAVLSGRK